MRLPLVSIITPSYNQAEYLEATIQSVLAQEYANLEYIIVDGGSTDGSLEIIQKYADQLAWWISEPDRGQADGINKGLRRARGEVVAWLNSDDLYLPGAIQTAVAALQADPDLGMVFGDALTIDHSGRPLNHLSFGDWGRPELMRFRIICQPAAFISRAALEEAGYLDENFHYMLDHHLWLRIASKNLVGYIPGLWAAARHHPAAKNVSLAPKFSLEIYRVLAWLKAHPDFQSSYQADQRRITGGAHRLAARYYLDGGQRLKALVAYGKALLFWPGYALKHWHRMAYAVLSLASFGRLDHRVIRLSQRRPPQLNEACLHGWPGLNVFSPSLVANGE
jgi:glycosyltransferase involved in cell wall biosynthesis